MGKLKKEKHNHKLTDFLKVGIFSLVMLAPFISIGSKMAYVALNKNAYQSYYGDTINEIDFEDVTNSSNLVIGEKYRLNNIGTINTNSTTGSVANNYITYNDIKLILPTDNSTFNNALLNSVKIGFYKVLNNTYLSYFVYDNTNTSTSYSSTIGTFSIEFVLTGVVTNMNILDIYNSTGIFESVSYNPSSYLDNVFEYAVNQLGETQIFSWTKNTAIYTPIETMTNGLGFDPNNNTLAILLTYWSLITAVYVIMDIILFAFTKITHFTQD